MTITSAGVRRILLNMGAKAWTTCALADIFYERPEMAVGRSVVVACNHTSVLDSLLAIRLMHSSGREWYVQAADQMIDRFHYVYRGIYLPVGKTPLETAKAISTTRRMMKDQNNRILWTYPQGDHFRSSAELSIKSGALHLSSPEVEFWCAWICYEVFHSTQPSASIGMCNLGVGKLSIDDLSLGLQAAKRESERLMAVKLPFVKKTFGN